ncbi:hypothetical protein SAMN05216466_10650 [Paraburkholderia phenazinium]|uniref:Uncharacterized protein n=1 Tax=Paraburkholderia phenazinium TaxID=60549 RepID=A0A1G7Y668_9BURK|nr:hypothetical protein [Paraburkholderia phenazinium]SDG91857.1 hypothetical protein SAMN05216466_10650 [Paraburkholderia phenazinium]
MNASNQPTTATTPNGNVANVPLALPTGLHQRASVQKLDQLTCTKYGFCGPVFVTTEALQDAHFTDGLEWFNGSYESVTTGETRDIGYGFNALFGFDSDAPNRLAFYVFISKRKTH